MHKQKKKLLPFTGKQGTVYQRAVPVCKHPYNGTLYDWQKDSIDLLNV